MRLIVFIATAIVFYALETRFMRARVMQLLDAKSLWKRLLGVYLTVACFVLLFGVPFIVLALYDGGQIALDPHRAPIAIGTAVRQTLRFANVLGLGAVCIRLAHDAFMWATRPRAQVAAHSPGPAPTKGLIEGGGVEIDDLPRSVVDEQHEARELFHRLWGHAGTSVYNKQDWMRLQQLLRRFDLPV